MGILHWEVLGYMGVWDGGVAWFGNLGHLRGCDRNRLAIVVEWNGWFNIRLASGVM